MSNSLDHLLTREERQAVEAFVAELFQLTPEPSR